MKEKRDIYRFLHVTPRRIFEQLDQYVVGQKHAKEVLWPSLLTTTSSASST